MLYFTFFYKLLHKNDRCTHVVYFSMLAFSFLFPIWLILSDSFTVILFQPGLFKFLWSFVGNVFANILFSNISRLDNRVQYIHLVKKEQNWRKVNICYVWNRDAVIIITLGFTGLNSPYPSSKFTNPSFFENQSSGAYSICTNLLLFCRYRLPVFHLVKRK